MPTVTFTFDAAQGARIATAYGTYLGLGRPATLAEVKADFVERLSYIVEQQEKTAAEKALSKPSALVVI